MAGLFYQPGLSPDQTTITLDGPEARHAAASRRIRCGEKITISDGAGQLAYCQVSHVSPTSVQAQIISQITRQRPPLRITLIQGLPKTDTADIAVRLASEAGADQIIAWEAQRSITRWDAIRRAKGLKRWNSIARAAAAQSRRPFIPDIGGCYSTSQLAYWITTTLTEGGTVILLDPTAPATLGTLTLPRAGRLGLIVGPEGGITPQERNQLTTAGVQLARLGPAILRCTTAGSIALGAISVMTDRWHIPLEEALPPDGW